MGLHVHLAIFVDRVSDDVWQTIYVGLTPGPDAWSAYSSTWDIHHVVRAVLENPVLQRL
jgi:hypothetical protein